MTPQTFIDDILLNMDGWCSETKAIALTGHVRLTAPKSIVEIGVFAGRSLFTMALSAPLDCKVFGIDPWTEEASVKGFEDVNKEWWTALDHNSIYYACKHTMKLLGINNVTLLCETSEGAINKNLVPSNIDLLHIDGNHSEASACYDVDNYVCRVVAGGYVWFDDMDWQTTKSAQVLLAKTCVLKYMTGTCGVYQRQ